MKQHLSSLIKILKEIDSAVLAYSGGVDSTFLLKAMKISGMRALAVTGESESVPPPDLRDAIKMAGIIGVPHRLIRTNELKNEKYFLNKPDRCFHCKDELFGVLRGIASREGYICVLDGSTVDDIDDYRPGREAAKKHGVRSPLAEAGIGKKKIRELSREFGLPVWDKPSSPCLASRIPYGMPVTEDKLRNIARAEAFLLELGLSEFRVRHHGEIARIEARARDFGKILEAGEKISEALRALGFKFICLDIEEFRSGSLNRVLDENK